jgi:hypothetical protein
VLARSVCGFLRPAAQGTSLMPLHIVGRHAPEDMCAHAIGLGMAEWALGLSVI